MGGIINHLVVTAGIGRECAESKSKWKISFHIMISHIILGT